MIFLKSKSLFLIIAMPLNMAAAESFLNMNPLERVYFTKYSVHFQQPARYLLVEELTKRASIPEKGVFCDVAEAMLLMDEERMLFADIVSPKNLINQIQLCVNNKSRELEKSIAIKGPVKRKGNSEFFSN